VTLPSASLGRSCPSAHFEDREMLSCYLIPPLTIDGGALDGQTAFVCEGGGQGRGGEGNKREGEQC